MTEIIAREPFDSGTQAYSGARFERGLRPDGPPVVLKHLPIEGDWLTRATRGIGRARLLWESGILDQVAESVEHPVIDVIREEDHDVVVMEDVSDGLFPADVRVSADEIRTALSGLAAMHDQWEGCELDGLCSPADRQSLFIPAFHEADTGPNPSRARDMMLAGWQSFAQYVPADVVEVVFAVHADPERLGRELTSAESRTLLHGDLKLDNLGLREDRLVAIDWGELTGTGPAEMDLAWFAAMNTVAPPGRAEWAVDAMPDEVFSTYEHMSGRGLDTRALDLSCIGMLAQVGCLLASLTFVDGVAVGEPARARAACLMDWWVDRVREARNTWSPV